MNAGFVNRLIGTIIVVIAAIVFIPNILDGEKIELKEGFKTIPERPEFKSVDLDKDLAVTEEFELSLKNQLPAVEPEIVDEVAVDATPAKKEEKVAQNTVVNTSQPEKVSPIIPDTVEVATLKPETTFTRPQSSNFTKYAYVIQLGSFSHKANVEALLAKLKLANFAVFTKPVYTPSGKLTKVFVGPELKKEKLEAKLDELKALTKLNGKITTFEVTK